MGVSLGWLAAVKMWAASSPVEWRAERQRLAELCPYLQKPELEFGWADSSAAKAESRGTSPAQAKLERGEMTEAQFKAHMATGDNAQADQAILSGWQLARAQALDKLGLPGFVSWMVHITEDAKNPGNLTKLHRKAYNLANKALEANARKRNKTENAALAKKLAEDFPLEFQLEVPGTQWWLETAEEQFDHSMEILRKGTAVNRNSIIKAFGNDDRFKRLYKEYVDHHDKICKSNFWEPPSSQA